MMVVNTKNINGKILRNILESTCNKSLNDMSTVGIIISVNDAVVVTSASTKEFINIFGD